MKQLNKKIVIVFTLLILIFVFGCSDYDSDSIESKPENNNDISNKATYFLSFFSGGAEWYNGPYSMCNRFDNDNWNICSIRYTLPPDNNKQDFIFK